MVQLCRQPNTDRVIASIMLKKTGLHTAIGFNYAGVPRRITRATREIGNAKLGPEILDHGEQFWGGFQNESAFFAGQPGQLFREFLAFRFIEA